MFLYMPSFIHLLNMITFKGIILLLNVYLDIDQLSTETLFPWTIINLWGGSFTHCFDIQELCSKANSGMPTRFLKKSICLRNCAIASRGALCWKERRQILQLMKPEMVLISRRLVSCIRKSKAWPYACLQCLKQDIQMGVTMGNKYHYQSTLGICLQGEYLLYSKCVIYVVFVMK